MAGKISKVKLLLFSLIGAIAGFIIGALIIPSYPEGSPRYASEAVGNKPVLSSMLRDGITGADPTDRTALIYLITAVISGIAIGVILTFLTSKKKLESAY